MTGLLLLMIAPAVSDFEVRLERMDGEQFQGHLVSANSDGLTVRTADGDTLSIHGEILKVQTVPPLAATVHSRAIRVELAGGTRLYATGFAVSKARASVEFADGRTVKVPTRAIRAVRLLPHDETLDEPWKLILESPSADDIVVIRKTSEPAADQTGPIAIVLDQLPGVVSDVDSSTIDFEFQGSEVAVPRAKVEGIIYHRTAATRLAEPLCELIEKTGSKWNVRSIQLKKDRFSVITISGVRGEVPFDQLIAIDYSLGNLTYLAELEPESSEFQPRVASLTSELVAAWFRPRISREPITLGGTSFAQSIALHSRTRVTYRLRETHQRFRAVVGIDERYRDLGNVELRIVGDSRVLFKREIGGRGDPFDLDVDISGVRRLTILVDFGEDGDDRGDHLVLCNARLTK